MTPTQAIEQIQAALGLSQHTRLLRLHTSLGGNVLMAQTAIITESFLHHPMPLPAPQSSGNALDWFDADDASTPQQNSAHTYSGLHIVIDALSLDAHLDLNALIGTPIELDMLCANASHSSRFAHITHIEQLASDGGLAHYRLVCQPWLHFLAHTQRSHIYQDMNAVQIIDTIFARHLHTPQTLHPAWQWRISRPHLLPRYSTRTQYQQSDLDFVRQILAQESLVAYWDYGNSNNDDDRNSGQAQLIITDHNHTFQPNRQARIELIGNHLSRTSQNTDSLQHWHPHHQIGISRVAISSPDYRLLSDRTTIETAYIARADTKNNHTGDNNSNFNPNNHLPTLSQTHTLPPYAYSSDQDTERQAQHLARSYLDAHQAQNQPIHASGSWRSAQAGTTFELEQRYQSPHQATNAYITLGVTHHAKNNLPKHLTQWLQTHLGTSTLVDEAKQQHQHHSQQQSQTPSEQLHHSQLHALPLHMPVRSMPHLLNGTASGGMHSCINDIQTAIVVGLNEPSDASQAIHTDRDLRIKVKFHWQQPHAFDNPNPSHDLAQADHPTAWLRAVQPSAGLNWGAHFTPRLGQEVVVAFLAGDVNRPVVTGSLYNGQRANQIGNNSPWFADTNPNSTQPQNQAQPQPHVLNGFKTQSLQPQAQQTQYTNHYNQLVFDNTPKAHRIELLSTHGMSFLQLGALNSQEGNQRLKPRGQGFDLNTQHQGAVRAGKGLLITTGQHAVQPSDYTPSPHQLETNQAQTQNQQAEQTHQALSEHAKAMQSQIEPSSQTQQHQKDLQAKLQTIAKNQPNRSQTQAPAWADPDMVLSSSASIALHTPKNINSTASQGISWVAGQDMNQLVQHNHVLQSATGTSLFAHLGLQLHAATGNAKVQALSGQIKAVAKHDVQVQSTQGAVKVQSPSKIELLAGGGGIQIEQGKITVFGPGKVVYKGAGKAFAGGRAAGVDALSLPKTELAKLKVCTQQSAAAAAQGDGAVSIS